MVNIFKKSRKEVPGLALSIVPVVALLSALTALIAVSGAESAQEWGPWLLGGAAVFATLLGLLFTRCGWRGIVTGIKKSATQILPAIPILLLIGTLSSTWMLSGVVPYLIDFGVHLLSPESFLLITCCVCSLVSMVTGSSWTTIATIGVAFMGVGTVMGYSEAWTAGAIISGAYFGDKMSPLSDTTVLASSSCGVDLFKHIRNMVATSAPALMIALIVYTLTGMMIDTVPTDAPAITNAIADTFNLSPWILTIPAVTCLMLALRAGTLWTLAAGSVAGLAGIWIFQPEIAAGLSDNGTITGMLSVLAMPTSIDTGNSMLDNLVATGGAAGMLPTVALVLCAMLFGGAMIGTGMLGSLARAITSRLHNHGSIVSATVGSGLCLNMLTGDQYLSLILGGNIYSGPYRTNGISDTTLSRSLEDSISVTSVLIPWNSCGLTQSTVLGVSTLAYAPFCIFNLLSPVMSIVVAWIQHRRKRVPALEGV